VHGDGEPDGEASTLLHDTVDVGDVLTLSLPYAASGIVVRTRRRSRTPAMAWARITRATRLWLNRPSAEAPSLSSAVIRGTPCARPVLAVDTADPLGQRRVRACAHGPCGRGRQPRVQRRARHLHDLAQPLHLKGVPVISDKLEAVHQRVSPAKYLTAQAGPRG
jgi:hypothetical protein